jgi:hypothetical protein
MRSGVQAVLQLIVDALDRLVAEMVNDCEHAGRSYCGWTVRLQHHYVELRADLTETGAKPNPKWRLTSSGTLHKEANG